MTEELKEYLATLKDKVSDGVKLIKEIKVDDEKFNRIINNINLASTVVVGIENRMLEQTRIYKEEVINEEEGGSI